MGSYKYEAETSARDRCEGKEELEELTPARTRYVFPVRQATAEEGASLEGTRQPTSTLARTKRPDSHFWRCFGESHAYISFRRSKDRKPLRSYPIPLGGGMIASEISHKQLDVNGLEIIGYMYEKE